MRKRGRSLVFSSKKAGVVSEIYLVIMELLLVIAVGAAIYNYVQSQASDLGFQKRFFAKDLAYTLEAVEGIPGNVDLYYSPSGKNIDLTLSVITPRVLLYEDPQAVKYVYRFPHDMALNAISYIDKSMKKPIVISKNANEIKMGYLVSTMEAQSLRKYFVAFRSPLDMPEIAIEYYLKQDQAGSLASDLDNFIKRMQTISSLDPIHSNRLKSCSGSACSSLVGAGNPHISFSAREDAVSEVVVYYAENQQSINMAKLLCNHLMEIKLTMATNVNCKILMLSEYKSFMDGERLESTWKRPDTINIHLSIPRSLLNFQSVDKSIHDGIVDFYKGTAQDVELKKCDEQRCKKPEEEGEDVCQAFRGTDTLAKCSEEGYFCCEDSRSLCETENVDDYGMEIGKFYCREKTQCSGKPGEIIAQKYCIGNKICCKGKQ